VLPVGGIKQKVLAAHRHGLQTVILPQANEVDLDDVPQEIRDELAFRLVEHLDEVLELALSPEVEFEITPDQVSVTPVEKVVDGNGRTQPAAQQPS
jgi:ATP-dependent Lon protease